jgi:hypothetical protein
MLRAGHQSNSVNRFGDRLAGIAIRFEEGIPRDNPNAIALASR